MGIMVRRQSIGESAGKDALSAPRVTEHPIGGTVEVHVINGTLAHCVGGGDWSDTRSLTTGWVRGETDRAGEMGGLLQLLPPM
jgi:hypothetical protein